MVALNASPVGEPKKIRWIMGDLKEVETLRSLGIKEGAVLTVTSSFCGNVIVALENLRYAIGNEMAYRIKVS